MELNLPPSEASFFTTLASIAATLLGLSFLALTFFLGSIFNRYDALKMPIYPDESRHQRQRQRKKFPPLGMLDYQEDNKTAGASDQAGAQRNPFDITDLQLFDGDPLVVFLAFAVAVSWNFYLVTLVVAVTVISPKLDFVWLVAGELAFFGIFLVFSLVVRQAQYNRLNPYRTRDERLWTPGEILFIVFQAGIILFACDMTLTQLCGSLRTGLCVAALPSSFPATDTLLVLIKLFCLVAFLLGLYATNKDFFVFFKAKASSEIRERWLKDFVSRYPSLSNRVEARLKDNSKLDELWHAGCPPPPYIRPGFSPYLATPKPSASPAARQRKSAPKPAAPALEAQSEQPDPRWSQLLQEAPTVAAWMFDVPGIAAWEQAVNDLLNRLQKEEQQKIAESQQPGKQKG